MAPKKSKVVSLAATNREAWLKEVGQELTPHVEKAVKDILDKKMAMPKWVATVGFPSKNALSVKKRVIGQCWHGMVSKDGVVQIFISPVIAEPMEVVATMAHEMIHAILPVGTGHNKPFPSVAKQMGLVGKPTATVAGEEFIKLVEPFIAEAPSFPHSPLQPNPQFKPQGTRLIKAMCSQCGYNARITKKWLVDAGAPICPTCNEPLEFDL
jgi:hypothetical protein